jgi:hypothetical protein
VLAFVLLIFRRTEQIAKTYPFQFRSDRIDRSVDARYAAY